MGSSECPGVRSETAGKEDACKGCPNQSYCSNPKPVDPDIEIIRQNLSKITKIVAIMSGKGGVGKSTFTRNIAESLSNRSNVCILDLDFSGPTIPKLTGTDTELIIESNNVMYPIKVKKNLSIISVGNFANFSDSTIYSSNLKTQLLKKILKQANFDNTDYLLIDTPPNVTDEHLGMATYIKPHGSVIVTTPQKISFQDVIRQVDFCKKAKIPIYGIAENMKGFVCTKCQKKSKVFQSSNVKEYSSQHDIKYLGCLGLDINIAKLSDQGAPICNEIFDTIADSIIN